MPRGNRQNLIPFNERSPEERKALQSKGGKNRVANIAKRKSMREWAQALGTEEIINSKGDKLARDAVVIVKQYEKAMKGDTRAAQFLAELLGEYKKDINILNVGEEIKLSFD